MSRPARVVSVVAVLVVVFTSIWWFFRPAEIVEEPIQQPVPIRVDARRIVAAPVEAEAFDAGHDERDAGVEITSSTHYLSAGNVKHEIHDSDIEFQRACTREAEACAQRFEVDRLSPLMAHYVLSGEPGSMRVVSAKRWNESEPMSPFADCLFKGLQALTFTETVGKNIGCTLHDFRRKQDPTHALVAAIGRCVGPKSEAEALTVVLSQRAAGNSVISDASEVTSIGRLDLSAENCIRAAAQLPPRPLSSSFVPRRHTLTVVLSSDETRRIAILPHDEARRVKRRFDEAPVDSPTTPESRRLANEADAALRRNDARSAQDLAARCVEAASSELACHRVLALAWLVLIHESPAGPAGPLAWAEFLRRAPPGDPDLPRVRIALIRSGITPP